MVKIGVFDSGIGGLSVLREILKQLPFGHIYYLADNLNHPYGPKSCDEIYSLAQDIIRCFIAKGVKFIVVACNTASGAALHQLRDNFPDITFVGMEPAVKPAAEHSRSRKVAVLATAGTLSAMPYAGVVERFAEGVEIFELPCAGLAEAIENDCSEAELEMVLRDWLEPVLEAGVDQIALACTHYPLAFDLITRIAGSEVTVIDPAPAIARQLKRVIALSGVDVDNKQAVEFFTSGSPVALQKALERYMGISSEVNNWFEGCK